MHVVRAYVYDEGTEYAFLADYFMYGDIDVQTLKSGANRVRSCALITSAETSLKEVSKALQYMIYHLRMNSVTTLMDTEENTMF